MEKVDLFVMMWYPNIWTDCIVIVSSFIMRKSSKGDFGREANCPVCNSKYAAGEMTVLESGQKRNALHFTCKNCKVSSLFFITENNIGMVGVGVLTDMSKSEVGIFFRKEAVSVDNVLEVHDFLKNIK